MWWKCYRSRTRQRLLSAPGCAPPTSPNQTWRNIFYKFDWNLVANISVHIIELYSNNKTLTHKEVIVRVLNDKSLVSVFSLLKYCLICRYIDDTDTDRRRYVQLKSTKYHQVKCFVLIVRRSPFSRIIPSKLIPMWWLPRTMTICLNFSS